MSQQAWREVKALFASYDTDGDGTISRQELQHAMKGMLSRNDIDGLFDDADADSNGAPCGDGAPTASERDAHTPVWSWVAGTLDFDEFAQLMCETGAFTGAESLLKAPTPEKKGSPKQGSPKPSKR